jgi:hypothetical protein
MGVAFRQWIAMRRSRGISRRTAMSAALACVLLLLSAAS